jgi:hypothetical protein
MGATDKFSAIFHHTLRIAETPEPSILKQGKKPRPVEKLRNWVASGKTKD